VAVVIVFSATRLHPRIFTTSGRGATPRKISSANGLGTGAGDLESQHDPIDDAALEIQEEFNALISEYDIEILWSRP
jgi:hypothetical protein